MKNKPNISSKIITYFVILFCFILFPFFLIYTFLDVFFISNTEIFRQSIIAEMDNHIYHLNKYSNNKKYFHFLLSKIAEITQKSNNPNEYLKINIDNLKKKYPDKFSFIVWDENGKVEKNISDKTSYNYILSKVYESLKEVTATVKLNHTIKISDLDIIKKNKNILHNFFGKIFIAENLKKPIYNSNDSGPFLTDVSYNSSSIWFSINTKASLLCFISNELLNDYSGLNKIVTTFNKKSEIIYGFSKIPNYATPFSKFPSNHESDITLALATFENGGDSFFENDRAIVKMAMPQPDIITFCFLPKDKQIWDYETNRNFWFGISISVLLFLYCILGFKFLYKHQFFSISWKLTSLFLLANLVPLIILGFITNKYIENKKTSLKNELTDDLEKTIREFDLHYNYLLENISFKINNITDDISDKIGNSTNISESEMNKLSALYNEVSPTFLYLIASDGQILLSRNSDSNSSMNLDLISSLGKYFLTYLNDKPVDIKQKKNDFYSSIYNPQTSDLYETLIKNVRHISEIHLGNSKHYVYYYTFGNKEKYNNNYILIIMWNSKDYQNTFMKEKINLLYKSFPNADFCIKSSIEGLFYGSDGLRNTINSILEKQSNERGKITGIIEYRGKNHIFICMNGTNLKYCDMLAVYPEELINKKIHIFIIQVITGALASFLLTIIIGQLLSIQFLKPIHNLGEATSAIGERNFSYRIPIGDKDEFGHLNQVFNRVIEGLEDFEVAKIIQESLLPSNNYSIGDFDIFAKTVVITTLGGNYYDCFKIDDKYLGIIIGDVAGHGIPAGLMMAMAKSAVLSASNEIKMNPTALTERLHKMFFSLKDNRLKRMMTFQYFVLNIENGHCIYTNAGHSYPILIDNNIHKANFMNYTSTPLGVSSKCHYKNKEFDLKEGQSLVLYTDSIVKTTNINGETFGYDRFLDIMPNHYNINPEIFYNNIYNNIYKQWSLKLDDDLTLILINRKKYE